MFDSLAWGPLAGARVRIVPVVTGDPPSAIGPELAARVLVDTTDADGRYAFDSLPAGRWRLAFDHPALDSLAIALPGREVRLAPGAAVDGTLGVPSRATLSRGCARASPAVPDAEGGLLLGTVREGGRADGRPVARAAVHVRWTHPEGGGAPGATTTTTAEDGRWRVCGVPAGAAVTAHAVAHGVAGAPATRVVPVGRRAARVDLVLPVTVR